MGVDASFVSVTRYLKKAEVSKRAWGGEQGLQSYKLRQQKYSHIQKAQIKMWYAYQLYAGWWFHISFIFTPGEMIQFDEHIFQMGWNHQLLLMAEIPNNHLGCF